MILSAVIAGLVILTPVAVKAGFFPADRQTYTCTTPTQCDGADHVQFNSFTNNPVVGDERPFFAGSLNGANVEDRIKVKNGDEIVLRAYVHNNADPNKIGVQAAIARNVKMKVLIPTATQADQNLVAFISSTNASPSMINDTMSLYGDKAFKLEYVTGSARFDRKDDGVNMLTSKLNDTIVADGTYLGDMNGCFAYSGYVTLRVKVVMEEAPPVITPEYKCDLLDVAPVAKRGVKITKFDTTAKNGAEFKNAVINWGDGSTELTTNNVVGQTHEYSKDGTYTVRATAYFTVNGQTVSHTSVSCAKNIKFESTTPPVVNPPATTTTPTAMPETGAGSVVAIFGGVVAASTLAYQFVSRRLGRQ